ncbi:hypothetical protein NRL14_14615 [Pseudoalteromonas sp. 20-92]|nr:hypothetical protein [Pseudoalteromonas sp. 20-92]MDQ2044967.1 hypothetical protein [Pseudoalteromonas sp. 20-92]
MNFAMDRPIVVVLDKLNALKVSDKTLGHILVDTLPAKQAKLAKLWNEWNKHNTNNVLQQSWEYKAQIDKFFEQLNKQNIEQAKQIPNYIIK